MDIQSVTKAVKKNIGEAVDAVSDKWSNMGKGTKIAMATVAGGVTIITAPFIVAAASGVSIVSALAILGGGAIAAGGFGVAGGIIVTAGGATLAATIAGVVTSKFADDPELIALKNQYAALEDRVKVQFAVMDKITKEAFEGTPLAGVSREQQLALKTNCKHAYESYVKAADKVAELSKKLEKSGKYDSAEVRKITAQIEIASDEMSEVAETLRSYGLI